MRNWAFIQKNLRDLDHEKKVILGAHFFTVLFCFFPWFKAQPIYGPEQSFNALQGPPFLIGFFMFVLAAAVVLYFADKIWESDRIHLPIKEHNFFNFCGGLIITFLILHWSVLWQYGQEVQDSEIRFGLSVVFLLQIFALAATHLHKKTKHHESVQSFFNHSPTTPPEKEKKTTSKAPEKHHPKNLLDK